MPNLVEPIQPPFLRQMLIDGIALKERRIQHQNQKIKTLHDNIRILSRAIEIRNQDALDQNWLTSISQGLLHLDVDDRE